MKKHLIDACCNMKGLCANCNQVMIRSDLDAHNCKQNPEQTITAQAARIKELEEENANLITDYKHALKQQQAKLQ